MRARGNEGYGSKVGRLLLGHVHIPWAIMITRTKSKKTLNNESCQCNILKLINEFCMSFLFLDRFSLVVHVFAFSLELVVTILELP